MRDLPQAGDIRGNFARGAPKAWPDWTGQAMVGGGSSVTESLTVVAAGSALIRVVPGIVHDGWHSIMPVIAGTYLIDNPTLAIVATSNIYLRCARDTTGHFTGIEVLGGASVPDRDDDYSYLGLAHVTLTDGAIVTITPLRDGGSVIFQNCGQNDNWGLL